MYYDYEYGESSNTNYEITIDIPRFAKRRKKEIVCVEIPDFQLI